MSPDVATMAEIFATVPAALTLAHVHSAWAEEVLDTDRLGSFLEGPCLTPSGELFVVDIAHGRILRISADGEFTVAFAYAGQPNGLALHRDGRLFVADRQHGIITVDLPTGTWESRVGDFEGTPLHGVNDLVFGPEGELYFTDQGHSDLRRRDGRVFRWREGRPLELIVDGLPSPNGIAVTPDGRSLYVAVTQANAVWRVALRSNGTVGRLGVFVQLSGGVGPDGLAMAEDGGLAVAHYGLGRVWLFDPAGRPLVHIDAPTGQGTTNVAYGGESWRTLWITEAHTGAVLRVETDRRGLPPYSHRPGRQAGG